MLGGKSIPAEHLPGVQGERPHLEPASRSREEGDRPDRSTLEQRPVTWSQLTGPSCPRIQITIALAKRPLSSRHDCVCPVRPLCRRVSCSVSAEHPLFPTV